MSYDRGALSEAEMEEGFGDGREAGSPERSICPHDLTGVLPSSLSEDDMTGNGGWDIAGEAQRES